MFNEHAVLTIAQELFRQITPHWRRVTGRFNMRGGVAVEAAAKLDTSWRTALRVRGFL